MKFTKVLLALLSIYFLLVLFDIFALNKEHNNGMASMFLTFIFALGIIWWAFYKIIKENEDDN